MYAAKQQPLKATVSDIGLPHESQFGVTSFPQHSDNDDLYSFDKKPAEGSSSNTYSRMGKTAIFTASGDPNSTRPMTSVRAAGFTRAGRTAVAAASSAFDPLNQGVNGIGGSSDKTPEQTLEEQIKATEKKIGQLVEESCMLAAEGNLQLALEKAKEAGKKERQLSKQREQANTADQANLDLTYSVLFNLANQYHANKMYQEALNTYALIVKNKLFNQSGRLRVNMGNIYYEQKKYSQAIKMYRMALDQIPNTNKEMRTKIMRNIGNAFINLGQFQDAITSFESTMDSGADFQAAFNLVLCYFALGDKELMKRGFQRLVSTRMPQIEMSEGTQGKDEPIEDHEIFHQDSLREMAREKRRACERYILMAAKLIAPAIEPGTGTGYDWIVETIKTSSHSEIASELEIAKSIQFLKTKDFSGAIESLKEFEKKDRKMLGTAATNLSFLYFLEGEYQDAEKYAGMALNADRYNAKAQTNLGNCHFQRGEVEKARQCYLEAISLDALCTEAMYNLGLVCKKLEIYQEALMWFEKLHTILRNNGEVIYQIADTYDKMGNIQQAMEWSNILISVVPTDPGVLARLGNMYSREGDKSQAFQYYSESYRYYPSNMDVISWLGAYYVECEVYEQAVLFFERAAIIQPQEVKWQLMIASCYRRSGNYQQAFETYKRIHEKFPENIECLRFLVRICTDLGMREVNDYMAKLTRLEQKKSSREGAVAEGLNGMPINRQKEANFELEKVDPNKVSGKKTLKMDRKTDEDEDWGHDDVNKLLPE